MPISGSTLAPTKARLNKARLGAFRLGDHRYPFVFITVNGVTRTSNSRVEGLTIRDYLDGQPNIATLRVDTFTPTKGHEIKIGLGSIEASQLIFAGNIQTVSQVYEAGRPANLAWDLTCTSYEWLLNRRKVTTRYLSTSASAIAASLIGTYTSGFTATNIESGLSTIDEIQFTNEDVTDCLDRLAKRVGAYWYIDNARNLHFFTTSEGVVQSITDGAVHGMKNLAVDTDLAPVKTRVYVEGGGSLTAAPLAIGSTGIPVEDASWYSDTGGEVSIGSARVTYASIDEVEDGSVAGTPIATPDVTSMSVGSSAGGSWAGTHWLVITYMTGHGETVASAAKSVTFGANQTLSVTSIPTSPSPNVSARRIYFTDGGVGSSGPFRYLLKTIPNNSTTSYTNAGTAEADAGSGSGMALPLESAAGYAEVNIPAGSTTLPVESDVNFPLSGWARVGGQVIRFTGSSGNVLTGIPSSGIGSITSAITPGSEVVNVAQLAGVPASGAGSLTETVPAGQPVNILVMAENGTAQTAMAGFVGGDGIHEEYLQDGRLSIAEAAQRAAARLLEVKDPLVTVRYDTTDQGTRSGREVTINLGAPTSISGTFKIQSVLITNFSANGAFFPKRTVEASSRRQSFEAILRLIKAAA